MVLLRQARNVRVARRHRPRSLEMYGVPTDTGTGMNTPASFPSAAEQCRAYIAELSGVIAVNAEIIERYAELGDDAGLEYQLRRLVLHVRAATATFKDLAAIENARRTESGSAE